MTNESLKFRSATRADTDALVSLVESAYRGDASKQGWTTEADMLDGRRTGADDIEACLSRADSRILLAERPLQDGGCELLACAHVAVEDGAGYFGMFSVRPNLQGGG
ncbi:MAG TPA: GNAT family N-acetyltransferase, partial [Lysobacter sp.]|nr:GNAT family N-acetyltransferase [Lysobacter sp.]